MKDNFNPITSPVHKLAFSHSLKVLKLRPDWIIQEAPAAPWFWWLSSFAWIHGLAREDYSPGDFATYCTKEVGTLVVNRGVFLQIAEKLVKQETSGQSVVGGWIKRWARLDKDYQGLVRRLVKADFDRLTDQDLLKIFQNFCQVYYAVESLPLANEFFIPYSDRYLKELALEYPAGEEKLIGLIMPKKKSFIQIEEDELRQITRLPAARQEAALKKHLAKWFFMNGGYDGPHPLSLRQLKNKTKKLAIRKELPRPLGRNRISLNLEARIILHLIKRVSQWKDERKRNNLIGSYILDKFAREFSRRFKIRYDLVRYAIPRELPRIVGKDKAFIQELVRRKRGGTAWAISGLACSDTFSGRNYQKLRQIILGLKAPQKLLAGIAASPGQIRGRIRVIHNPAWEKFTAGDILLTSMTRPEFVPLIKKAKAVLCDEGGLLSHAAIVSREFKIPCIVGLHQAMASLKDGDLVEVNADKGIVKILKR